MRKMKDSGIDWIGQIPEEWRIEKAKHIFVSRKEKGNANNLELLSPTQKYGVIPQSKYQEITGMKPVQVSEEADLSDFRTVHTGDFCISLSAYMGGFEYSKYEGVISPAYTAFYKTCTINDRYYMYLFKSVTFIDEINRITPQSVRVGRTTPYEKFAQVVLPIPPTDVQSRIADYLDEKCGEIDRYIEKQQQIIEKLKAYKQAVITEAVTKGLDPTVPTKDSGIEWIGMIPAHWKTPEIKYLATISSGGTPDRNHPEYWNGTIAWIKTGELQNNELYDSDEHITEEGLEHSSAHIFPQNTILMAMYGQGKTRGMTALLKKPASTNQACAGLTINSKDVLVEYLWKCLIGAYDAIRSKAEGSGQPNLSAALINEFYVTLPPIEEQKDIIRFISEKTNEITNSIHQIELIVNKMTEYKKSFIYEAVTGKLEV